MNLFEILIILLIHWVADFVLQTDKQAQGKSKRLGELFDHTVSYSFFWLLAGVFYIAAFDNTEDGVKNLLIFVSITFIWHSTADYFTSKINARFLEEKKNHKFFVSLGFGQWLHYLQLFTTYWLLTK